MINRYQGNSGKYVRFSETGSAGERTRETRSAPTTPEAPKPQSLAGLGRFLPEKLSALENEDLILMLILYLMYRESGDSELLMILGAMLLL